MPGQNIRMILASAVLALSRPGGLIVCNGYKDREYIRLAPDEANRVVPVLRALRAAASVALR